MGAGRAEPVSHTHTHTPSLCTPPGLHRQPTGTGGGRDGDPGAAAFGVPPSLLALPRDLLGPHGTLASLFPPCSPTPASLAGCPGDSAPAPCLQARGGVSETGGVWAWPGPWSRSKKPQKPPWASDVVFLLSLPSQERCAPTPAPQCHRDCWCGCTPSFRSVGPDLGQTEMSEGPCALWRGGSCQSLPVPFCVPPWGPPRQEGASRGFCFSRLLRR